MLRIFRRSNMGEWCFFILFAFEFTYYLLILQTGVVVYENSDMREVWMLPVGGMTGIVLSYYLYDKRSVVIPLLLALQGLVSLHYPDFSFWELALLGLISGMSAPMLLYRIRRMDVAVGALGLSYLLGTTLIFIDAAHRMEIAVVLTAVAFVASLFSGAGSETLKTKTVRDVSVLHMGVIFAWLFLDATLFETLSRDMSLYIWENDRFTLWIVLFHIVGLVVAYYRRDKAGNDIATALMFLTVFTLYALQMRSWLAVIYPFVISYYNVLILAYLQRLRYLPLVLLSLSLWAASGLGLFTALQQVWYIGWPVAALLLLVGISRLLLPEGLFPSVKMLIQSRKGGLHS